jgi:hypothetical protein
MEGLAARVTARDDGRRVEQLYEGLEARHAGCPTHPPRNRGRLAVRVRTTLFGLQVDAAVDGEAARPCKVDWVRKNIPTTAGAVVIGGNGFRAVGVIEALEADLDRPVLTANQVLLWAALAAAGANPATVQGYGRIFGTPPPR